VASEKPNILVVDDDPNILKIIELRLASNGYGVSSVTDPEMAVELVKDNYFNLALLDLKLLSLLLT
jgi:two-component system response regulator GlrR